MQPTTTDKIAEKLIVALDVSSSDAALGLVRLLKTHVGYFKIGLQLFTSAGPRVVENVLGEGAKVFLDLKLHDIPHTVASAAVEAARIGAHMMTLHTLGGEFMMEKTVETIREFSQREGWPAPRLLGITVLTSMQQAALCSVGIEQPLDDVVLRLAKSAHKAGLDGIVSSPRELRLFHDQDLGPMLYVTPGIRPTGAPQDDQQRTMTPSEAVKEGADYLVIGRPVTAALDPVKAIRTIIGEMHLR